MYYSALFLHLRPAPSCFADALALGAYCSAHFTQVRHVLLAFPSLSWTHLHAECVTAPFSCICVRLQVVLRTHLHLERTVVPILRKCVTYYWHFLHFRGRTCTQDVSQPPFTAFASSYCMCAHRLGAENGTNLRVPTGRYSCPHGFSGDSTNLNPLFGSFVD